MKPQKKQVVENWRIGDMDPKTFLELDLLWSKSIQGKMSDPNNDRTSDGKRAFMGLSGNDGWKDLRLEVDTDDCDSDAALASATFLMALWNAWPMIRKELVLESNPT